MTNDDAEDMFADYSQRHGSTQFRPVRRWRGYWHDEKTRKLTAINAAIIPLPRLTASIIGGLRGVQPGASRHPSR
jgi:hypothetical protein